MTRLTDRAKENYLLMLRGEKPRMSSGLFTPVKGPTVPERKN